MRLKAETVISLSKLVKSWNQDGVRLTGCVTLGGDTIEIVLQRFGDTNGPSPLLQNQCYPGELLLGRGSHWLRM